MKHNFRKKTKSNDDDDGGGGEVEDSPSDYLVIVESPSKIKKIRSFLGKNYKVIATSGHFKSIDSLETIRHFFKENVSITPEFDLLTSLFKNTENKKQKINELKRTIRSYDSSNIFIATDNDREGEAIAFHIISSFGLKNDTKRIKFNEISFQAITTAIANPTTLNIPLVKAQITRMCVDYLIGFTLSPLLYNLTHSHLYSLSAGRCQTIALRLIYENYKEQILKKNETTSSHKFFRVKGVFFERHPLHFTHSKEFNNPSEVRDFLERSQTYSHSFILKEKKTSIRNSPVPFNTAKLLQTASNTLGYSPKLTMSIAQKLYQSGKITYLRTESMKYSKEFIDKTVSFIHEKCGGDNAFIKNDLSQLENDALNGENPHEAIRPTDLNGIYDETEPLYRLIWKNTVQSCMSSAVFDLHEIWIDSPIENEYYTSSLEIPVFLGWKKDIICENVGGGGDPKNKKTEKRPEKRPVLDNKVILLYLQNLSSTPVYFSKLESEIILKNKHCHYTESSLIQILEDLGIGRPSTYSQFVETIKEREYVIKTDIEGIQEKNTKFTLEETFHPITKIRMFEIKEITELKTFENEKNKLVIQPIGIVCIEYLMKYFEDLFQYEYTNNFEKQLDEIALNHGDDSNLFFQTVKDFIDYLDNLVLNAASTDGGASSNKKPKKKDEKITFKIDENNDFVFHQNGLCVRRKIVVDTVPVANEDAVPPPPQPPLKKRKSTLPKMKKIVRYEYYPIKKSITIDHEKMKSGSYNLEEILEYPESNLGEYNGTPLKIKTGQHGHYLEWGTAPFIKTKSLKTLDPSVSLYSFQLKDAIDFIEREMNDLVKESDSKRIYRVLDPFTSIRHGKYGAYVYHKTEQMHKPEFISLKKCPLRISSATTEELMNWVNEKLYKTV